jgi:YgiT-type zinc finger domain-containing protein
MKRYFCSGEMKKGKTTCTINKKMEPCSLCDGEMEKKVVEVIKEAGEKVVVVKNVPAWVCKQCGERYYSIDTVERINGMVREVSEEKVKIQKPYSSGGLLK